MSSSFTSIKLFCDGKFMSFQVGEWKFVGYGKHKLNEAFYGQYKVLIYYVVNNFDFNVFVEDFLYSNSNSYDSQNFKT